MSQITIFESVLYGFIVSNKIMNIVQVGANDGKINDPIYNFVMKYKKNTNILLIEPQPELLHILKENYSGHPSAVFFSGAIGQPDTISLYRVKPDLWPHYNPPYLKDAPSYRVPSGFTSYSIEHVYNHARGNFKIDLPLAHCVEEIRVACQNLLPLMSKLSWTHDIDLLQIDTEGADDITLMSCNISQLKPKLICFETIHLGQKRCAQIAEYLIGEGYELIRSGQSDMIAMLDPRRKL